MKDHRFAPVDQLPVIDGFPDPFLRENGQRVQTKAEWKPHRNWLKSLLEHYLYGPWPETTDDWEAVADEKKTALEGIAIREMLRLTSPEGASIRLEILRPNREGRFPVFVFNSMTDNRCPIEAEVIRRGYAVAMFNRHDIVHDPTLEPAPEGKIYPQLACSTIMAWGWGHSLVADYLAGCDFTGPLVATGHSRGGKAALCAAIFDERFAGVAPINSGCGGLGALRVRGSMNGVPLDSTKTETIGALTHGFPDWFNDVFASFGSDTPPYPMANEARVPFDANTLRALVAPRWVVCSEGTEDLWANPYGTQCAWEAAQPVFDWLGAPDSNAFFVRPGGHDFGEMDWAALLDFSDARLYHKSLDRSRFYRPVIEE